MKERIRNAVVYLCVCFLCLVFVFIVHHFRLEHLKRKLEEVHRAAKGGSDYDSIMSRIKPFIDNEEIFFVRFDRAQPGTQAFWVNTAASSLVGSERYTFFVECEQAKPCRIHPIQSWSDFAL